VPAPKGSKGKATVRSVTVREYHLGSDLMAPKGTDVHTVGDAKVSFAGRMGGFGKLIILDHGLGYQTYYAHLSEIKPWIKVGASVARGDVIGLVGSTGHSTAPHLHFETRKDAKFIDPFDGTRQLDFWLLTPDDQERLAMKLLAKPATALPTESAAETWARKANENR
jgi:murein DD-endopeptidase MepM/ murein hydrolase activator NlpD